jgi:hypothetical protein
MAMLPGCPTYDELYATDNIGTLTHGTAFVSCALNSVTDGGVPRYCYPASHAQYARQFAGAMPIGARIRLRATFPINSVFDDALFRAEGIDPIHAQAMRRWLTCLQRYGAILIDGTAPSSVTDFGFMACYDPRWNNAGTDVCGIQGNNSGTFWTNAFRFGQNPWTGRFILPDWRPNAYADTFYPGHGFSHVPMYRWPMWFDFEVVERGWPVDRGNWYTYQ